MRLCNDIKLNSTKSKTMVTILFVNLIKNSPYHYYQFPSSLIKCLFLDYVQTFVNFI